MSIEIGTYYRRNETTGSPNFVQSGKVALPPKNGVIVLEHEEGYSTIREDLFEHYYVKALKVPHLELIDRYIIFDYNGELIRSWPELYDSTDHNVRYALDLYKTILYRVSVQFGNAKYIQITDGIEINELIYNWRKQD